MAAPPELTSGCVRAQKTQRIRALVNVDELASSIKRNSLKEDVILEYVANFRAQFTQLYPSRRPLLLAPVNEAGVSKFCCTSLRPTMPAARELYDAAACAKFLATYVKYEPLEVPTELPAALPSPDFVLMSRRGDCLDCAVTLASLLLGNGFDAYVLLGTAPKWVTLKEEDKSGCDFSVPGDAVDASAHASPAALGLVPPPAPAAAQAKAAAAAGNRYKLPPPTSLDSAWLTSWGKEVAEAAAAAAAATSLDSDDEGAEAELTRLRRGYATVVEAAMPSAQGVDKDPLSGRRVHAWVLVRAREGGRGGRQVDRDSFYEPSTGARFAPSSSPYLEVEAAFNHKNYWVNMQATGVLPVQDTAVTGAEGGGPAAGLFGAGDALSSTFRAALKARGAQVRGSGGGIAVAATAATLEGKLGAAAAATSLRPDLLSPYMATMVAAKALAEAKGDPDLQLDFNFHAGAPRLEERTTGWVLGNPLPVAAPAPAPVAAAAVPAESKEGEGGDKAAEGGEGGEGDGGAPVGAAAEGGSGEARPTSAAAGAADTAPSSRTDAASAPPSRSGSRASSRGGPSSRSSSRIRGPRAASRGHVPGSLPSWRVVLSRQAAALQAQAAEELAASALSPPISALRWDLNDSTDWEYVMIPYERMDEEGGAPGEEEGGALPPPTPAAEDEGAAGEGEGAGEEGVPPSARPPLPPKDKYAGIEIERAGDHVLDMPGPWSPKLTLDRYVTGAPLGAAAGHAATALFFRSRLDTYDAYASPNGLVSRLTAYSDSRRAVVTAETSVFAHRKDGLFKAVLRPTAPLSQELHYARGRPGGLAMAIEVPGVRRAYYFYAGSRVDGLRRRVELLGVKCAEEYGPEGGRTWYRSVSFVPGAPRGASALPVPTTTSARDRAPSGPPLTAGSVKSTSAPAGPAGGYSVEVEHKVEAGVRKMAEKYRRDPAVHWSEDVAKVVFHLMDGTIVVTYHAPPGRLARVVRVYVRSTGVVRTQSNDVLEPPTVTPFDADNAFRRLLAVEKDCHAAMRASCRSAIEIRQLRSWEAGHPELERSSHTGALERARAGFPLEDERESKEGTYTVTAAPCHPLPHTRLHARPSQTTSRPNPTRCSRSSSPFGRRTRATRTRKRRGAQIGRHGRRTGSCWTGAARSSAGGSMRRGSGFCASSRPLRARGSTRRRRSLPSRRGWGRRPSRLRSWRAAWRVRRQQRRARLPPSKPSWRQTPAFYRSTRRPSTRRSWRRWRWRLQRRRAERRRAASEGDCVWCATRWSTDVHCSRR